MRALLLAVVSLTVAVPAPADAQFISDVRFAPRSGTSHHGFRHRHGDRDRDRDRDRHRHRDRDRDRDFDDSVFFYDYYRDYQGDTAWKSDSFNDWWHDRPDRAYPRWVVNNQNCERRWWGGDTLRC